MEATNPPNHTLGSVSYPSSTLERHALCQEGTNPIGFQNHTHGISGATASIPPLPHEPVDGESNDEYAEQESIGPVAEDWNEGHYVGSDRLDILTKIATLTAVSPRLRCSGDFFHDLDYDPNSRDLEDSHHYSCECSLCEAENYEANIDEAQVFESLMTSVSQYSEETGTSQVSDHPFAETELQSANGPPFPTVYLPEVQQLSSRTEVLRFLERHDGGKATCLWINEGGECGFLSQIDLVKRHIKRVHFRLRWVACGT